MWCFCQESYLGQVYLDSVETLGPWVLQLLPLSTSTIVVRMKNLTIHK